MSKETGIDKFSIEDVISTCGRTCLDYNIELTKRIKDNGLQEEDNEIIFLMQKVTGYDWVPDGIESVFPEVYFYDRRKINPRDLTEPDLKILFNSLEMIKDPELKARVYDVLLDLRYDSKSHTFAEGAIKNYLQSATTLLNTSSYLWESRLERAARIFRDFNLAQRKGISEELNVIGKIQTIIEEQINQEDIPIITISKLIMILRKYTDVDMVQYLEFLKEQAGIYEVREDFRCSKELWNVCLKICKDKSLKNELNRNLANATYQEALQAINAIDVSPMRVSTLLAKAFKAYKKVLDSKDIRDEIYNECRRWQLKIPGEMEHYKYEIDATEEINLVVKKISGLDKNGALIAFCFLSNPISMEYVNDLVDKGVGSVLLQTVTKWYYDEEVKTTYSSENITTEHHRCYCYIRDHFIRKIILQSRIHPAWLTLKNEHCFTMNDCWSIAEHSQLVPLDRIDLFARAIYFGFNGDFVTFAHLIIPQIDNAFRKLLLSVGIEDSKLLDDGTQESNSLKWALSTHGDKLGSIIGDDMVFDLRGLLIEKSGSNLRHNIAHGSISGNAMLEDAAYLFWLTMKLIIQPYPIDQQALEM